MARKIKNYCNIVFRFPDMDFMVTGYETVYERCLEILIKFRTALYGYINSHNKLQNLRTHKSNWPLQNSEIIRTKSLRFSHTFLISHNSLQYMSVAKRVMELLNLCTSYMCNIRKQILTRL